MQALSNITPFGFSELSRNFDIHNLDLKPNY